MSPKRGEGGELRGLSQWAQLYTGAQINFGDLTPYLTYRHPTPSRTKVNQAINLLSTSYPFEPRRTLLSQAASCSAKPHTAKPCCNLLSHAATEPCLPLHAMPTEPCGTWLSHDAPFCTMPQPTGQAILRQHCNLSSASPCETTTELLIHDWAMSHTT